jgi:chromate transporter
MPTPQQPSIAQLFISFLRLGVTAFGGPSMVVYIRKMAVEQKGWLDADVFDDGVALCQMIPGATAMQTAAYVGLKSRGVIGAGASFIGFGLPAFLLMMVFAAAYTYTRNLSIVISAFSGLQAIIVAIVANAMFMFGRKTLKNWKLVLLAAGAAALFGLNINPILVILFAAVSGLVLVKTRPAIARLSMPAGRTTPTFRQLLILLSLFSLVLVPLYFFRRNLFDLSISLVRIDLMAFGGGFASVPLMFHEIVEIRGWLDSQTFMNGIVLGQVTPGPIVITATFIGYLLDGVLGGLVATVSIFMPSFALVVGITPYYERLRRLPLFYKVVDGVLCSFVGFLFTVTIRFALNVHWDWTHFLLALAAFVALRLKVDILWVILLGTLASIILIL